MSLLLRYLFLYPFYYVAAMALASVLAAYIKSWGVEQAKIFFMVTSISMALASYLIHWRIAAYGIGQIIANRSNGKHNKA